jgi:hypothetical protein
MPVKVAVVLKVKISIANIEFSSLNNNVAILHQAVWASQDGDSAESY